MNSALKVTINRFLLGVAFLLVGMLTGKITLNISIVLLVIMIILALGYYFLFTKKKTKN